MLNLDYGQTFKRGFLLAFGGGQALAFLAGAAVVAVCAGVVCGLVLSGSPVWALLLGFLLTPIWGSAALGLAHVSLRSSRGEQPSFSDLRGGLGRIMPAALVAALVFVATMVGFLAFAVPGVFVLALASHAFYELADSPEEGAWVVARRAYERVGRHFSAMSVLVVVYLLALIIGNVVLGALPWLLQVVWWLVMVTAVVAFLFSVNAVVYVQAREEDRQAEPVPDPIPAAPELPSSGNDA